MIPIPIVATVTIIIAVVIGFIFMGLLFYFNKTEIKLKELLIWILFHILVFGLVGMWVAVIPDFVKAFWLLQVISLVLGAIYVLIAIKMVSWWELEEFSIAFITTEIIICWGVVGVTLGVVFINNRLTALLPYLVSGVLPFLLPLFLIKAYNTLTTIETKRYKRWVYNESRRQLNLEPVDIIVVNIRFTKLAEEKVFEEKNGVELPGKHSLGDLFQYFIQYYNMKEGKLSKQIYYKNHGQLFEWEFYRVSLLNQRFYLDPDKTLIENNVGQNEIIYAESFIN